MQRNRASSNPSVLRVEEKRKGFFDEAILSNQCFAWLVSTMGVLLGFPGDKGSKVMIVRRGGYKDGRFLEAAAFGMGYWREILLIPEGRGGWGWHKFSSELRKASDFLSATMGCGSSSSSSAEKKGGKEEGLRLGLIFFLWAALAAPVYLGATYAFLIINLSYLSKKKKRKKIDRWLASWKVM